MAFRGVLVKVSGDGKAFSEEAARSFGPDAAVRILEIPPSSPAAAGSGATWFSIPSEIESSGNAWDDLYAVIATREPLLERDDVLALEPNIEQGWPGDRRAANCNFKDQTPEGTKAIGPGFGWSLGKDYSQLSDARKKVGDKQAKIVIAHLDTGFDPLHVSKPRNITLQRNFVDDGHRPDDATDHAPANGLFQNRGHGTATIAMLAGDVYSHSNPPPSFHDYLGGAPLAKVIAVRIANWVVRLTTKTMVQGFDYALKQGAHVLSMSMGGLPSEALADAVTLAYRSGLVAVTAAGNNFASYPMRKIVWPARYPGVIAACGVMADGRAYAQLTDFVMEGNYGPPSKMDTALGGYTPNVHWAELECPLLVNMYGAGTSSATPQIAAAAALWLAEHWNAVAAFAEPWHRVEAVRYALFKSAKKKTDKMDEAETHKKIGRGVMKASDALGFAPPKVMPKALPPTEAVWRWLYASLPADLAPQRRKMLALELMQMSYGIREVDEAIEDPDLPAERISDAERKKYLTAAFVYGYPSKPLRTVLGRLLQRD